MRYVELSGKSLQVFVGETGYRVYVAFHVPVDVCNTVSGVFVEQFQLAARNREHIFRVLDNVGFGSFDFLVRERSFGYHSGQSGNGVGHFFNGYFQIVVGHCAGVICDYAFGTTEEQLFKKRRDTKIFFGLVIVSYTYCQAEVYIFFAWSAEMCNQSDSVFQFNFRFHKIFKLIC